MDKLVDIAVAAVLKPLVAKAKEFGEPLLKYVPDDLEVQLEDKLTEFVTKLLKSALEMLTEMGLLKITTTGEIHLTPHKGPHPDDVK